MSNKTHTATLKKQFQGTYDEHSDALFRFAFYKLSDREKAKDIVQDAFVKFWEYLRADGEVSNPKALLFRIASNAIIDNYRKHKEMSLDILVEDGFDPGDHTHAERIVEQADGALAMKLLNRLEEPLRHLLMLRYVDGLSVKEIAEITDQRENTVSVRIHRALKDLKDMFEKND
ncbi:MAG: hypothetical protein RL094_550 [Candidatus Parcubacteria bacterium]|jgi:RNA polymerase sigma-70 factor (ECF subfamily)